MAEQVEKGLTLEAVSWPGSSVTSYGDAVEKAVADNECGIRVDVQEKKADKMDETPGSSPGQALGGAIRAMSQKKDSTIVEGCGLAG